MGRKFGWLFALLLAGLTSVGIVWIFARDTRTPSKTDQVARPKLVVLFVFDQMRGDYPKKWQPLFGEGGFKRLQTEGAWFTDCHYPYAYTVTAAGHTSLVTGATPSKHGIIGNDWYDRATGEF